MKGHELSHFRARSVGSDENGRALISELLHSMDSTSVAKDSQERFKRGVVPRVRQIPLGSAGHSIHRHIFRIDLRQISLLGDESDRRHRYGARKKVETSERSR
jgi:hypothetical protein